MQRKKKVLPDDHDSISHFIWCVKKRPPLYNYKLPSQQRRRSDVARMWQELANEIGNVTSAECRKKWKNLRDTYHQYRLRKIKYKECLQKWRYTKDLSFLTDIYQPKLKSERANYLNSSQNNQVQDAQPTDISTLIDLDEESIQENESLNGEIFLDNDNENDFEDNIEHVIDLDGVHFCDVSEGNAKETDGSNDTYEEIHLYDESDNNVQTDSYTNINDDIGEPSDESSGDKSVSESITIGSNKNELDLFFQFLRTKIENLPSVDITAIQIEFLNAVLQREAARAAKNGNSRTT